jgi:hypothetical protein
MPGELLHLQGNEKKSQRAVHVAVKLASSAAILPQQISSRKDHLRDIQVELQMYGIPDKISNLHETGPERLWRITRSDD